MDASDVKYIFDETGYKKMHVYKDVKTVNTMKQYVNKVKKLGFNHEVYDGENGQKAIKLIRKNGELIGELKNSTYPNNVIVDRSITKDKLKAEKLLALSGVGTTTSQTYQLNQMEQAKKEFFEKNPDDLAVIKPSDMSQGKGVNVRVGIDNFPFYWEQTKRVMMTSSRKNGKVIVQKYLEGFEARAVVISGKLISIVARVPAHVVGNGDDNVLELINKKNKVRQKCGHLRKKLINPDKKIERFLDEDNLSFQYIPKKDEYVLLTSISNTSLGGDMVDITKFVSINIKELALDAIAAVPGFVSGGIDLMIKDFSDKEPKVIEINSWPMLQSTLYPTYGEAMDPQTYFLESYFALDQYMHNIDEKYEIKKENEYIRTYLDFQRRKQSLHVNAMIQLL